MSDSHILIVDDDMDIRATLADFLEDEGYTVGAAANGREALDYLRKHPETSVVLVDLMMPVMDGFQFRAEQKNDPELASIPVVVMTARGRMEPGTIDVQDIVAKPLKLPTLLEAIRRAEENAPARKLPAPRPGIAPAASAALPAPEDCIAGGGEMGALMRAMDWQKTGLGPISAWSQSLRMMVRFLLANRFPLLLWWGPEYISIYNDPYRPILGAKHPWALGRPLSECWSEIWHVLKPLVDTPFKGGPSTWNDDILLEINRQDFLEETHFTVAYSPVPDDTVVSGIGGVLATVHEITDKVVAERRVVALRDLGARVGEAKTADEACAIAAESLAAHAKDVPFALLYLVDPDGTHAHLAGATGVAAGHEISPMRVDVATAQGAGWPFAEALRTQDMQIVTRLHERFVTVPPGPWFDAPKTGVVAAIPSNISHAPAGLIVLGVSARLKFDTYYRDFFDLVRTQVATAIGKARAYEEERKRADALAELDRGKTAFFSNVSHEFRTPLTLMLSPLEDLLGDARAPLSPMLREELEVVHRNAVRLLKLVNTLLDFSRIEAGRVQAVYEATDLSRLTADLASVFRAATEKAALKMKVDCPPLPEKVYVDREMWEKIVLNLISNAFKFTFEGEIAVVLRWAGDHAELEVRDTGTGIPPQELPHVFERFHRVEGARARTHEGSGIGLALVQELVKLHQGVVRVASTMGKGTTFTVSIPTGTAHLPNERIDGSRALAPTSVGSAAFVEEGLSWLPRRPTGEIPVAAESVLFEEITQQFSLQDKTVSTVARILVADDNADMRDYVSRLLSQRWTVETVSNGADALVAARKRPPDLVLTDVMMPELDGFGLLRELRADPRLRTTPVIVLSARAGEEARVEGLEAGADDYLIKPFSARELTARVASQLALAKARGEADREREARLDDLQRTVRVSEMFVGILGHDLRNPLSAISTAASLLVRRGEESEKISKPAIRILNSADRMQRMIGQLLDFTHARLGTGIPLRRNPTDLADVCRLTIEELEGDARSVIQFESTGDTVGDWDRDRLIQLGSNLLGNAVTHGRSGAPVKIQLDGTQPEVVQLEIRNGGIVPPELLPVLFEPFRSSREKREGSSGLGLGLYITNQIVLAHGGRISVRSLEPDETCFAVELPRRRPSDTTRTDVSVR